MTKDYIIKATNVYLDNILKNISLEIKNNEIITIIGPNGGGKTSLIKILLGLLPVTGGKIKRKKSIKMTYMPQKIQVDSILPLTIMNFLRLNGKKELRNRENVEKIVEKLNISHLMQKQIHNISGGEMQRVMLARVFLTNADILVLDEPTQGMDVNAQSEFYQIIQDYQKKHKVSVIIVSHDLHLVMKSTDRVICINSHICCEGCPEAISKAPEYLKLFGKSSNVALYKHHHDHKH